MKDRKLIDKQPPRDENETVRRDFEAPRLERAGELPVITAGSVDLHVGTTVGAI
ncbi:MAG: hypothetical protein HKN13_11590 [Rhodothermales bacterium]|nr:hypothetical protein [Rhodothermales bacterium]